MLKCGIIVSEFYKNNRLFNINDEISNRDNCLYHWHILKNKFIEYGIELTTYDQYPDSNYSIIIFSDLPDSSQFNFNSISNTNKHLYLILFESELIKPNNWDRKNHKYFNKIFTWNDEIVDAKKYIKFYWPNKIPNEIDFDLSKKNKFCTMIIAHKFKSHPLELYTERVKAIRWFEKNHPQEFDLYGIGWDRYYFKGALSRLNGYKFLTKALKPQYPSYKGAVKTKREILQKYKFAICYENARDIPGYITEKIFDCFFAGCVPIYYGAPNVTEHIPEDTFIDRRNFRTYDELYSYLKKMPDREYMEYLDAIKDFIKSDKIYQFSAECFAERIVSEILKEG